MSKPQSAPIPPGLIKTLQKASHVVALTGSGVSAESGVPTFREAQSGLWAQYDPSELATPQAFKRNPQMVWEWYVWRRQLIRNAEPNSGHLALAALESLIPEFTIITQNIDGLHRNAGSINVVELHGNIFRTKCSVEDRIVSNWLEDCQIPPCCPYCGELLRPDVVWFGESLPELALSAAIQATESSEVFFSIGTSSIVQPAASLPLHARSCGAIVVEINVNPTLLTSHADYVILGPSGTVLPALVFAAFPGNRSQLY